MAKHYSICTASKLFFHRLVSKVATYLKKWRFTLKGSARYN